MKHIRTKLNATYIGLTVLVLLVAGFIIDIEIDAYFHSRLADDLEHRADLILDAMKPDSGNSDERIKMLARSAERASRWLQKTAGLCWIRKFLRKKFPLLKII